MELGARWSVHGCAVSYALQTNGLLIDEEWCRFLAQHHFLVGVSLDGTKDSIGKSYYCEAYRQFFPYTYPWLE